MQLWRLLGCGYTREDWNRAWRISVGSWGFLLNWVSTASESGMRKPLGGQAKRGRYPKEALIGERGAPAGEMKGFGVQTAVKGCRFKRSSLRCRSHPSTFQLADAEGQQYHARTCFESTILQPISGSPVRIILKTWYSYQQTRRTDAFPIVPSGPGLQAR